MSTGEVDVVIMAGGTGGHIFPGLAVAQCLVSRGQRLSWLGGSRGLESTLVPQHGHDLDQLQISGLRGKGALGWLLAPFRIMKAVWQALTVLRRRRPGCVVSFGGYAAGPGGLAAVLLRIPLLVHEQNRVPGLTNSQLARFARQVFQGFPDSFDVDRGAVTVGNPVRRDIADLPEPSSRLADREGPVRVLVLGGSQGAHALNTRIPPLLAGLKDVMLAVRHQCGERHLEQACKAYQAASLDAQVTPFISEMAEAYGWADLVICRAGALTVAELAAAGVASVLVPFPAAVDDHQTRNARYLTDDGAAELLPESALDHPSTRALLQNLLGDRDRLLAMAGLARKAALPAAAERLCDAIEAVLRP